VNPATGKPYGPDFPTITLRDMIRAQHLLLESLGVRHLVAVAGPSFGGYQAFQWAVQYPDFMHGVVPVVTAPKGSGGDAAVKALADVFAKDPNWNGGWYYDRGGIPATMAAMRVETLKRYGQNEILALTIPDPDRRDARIREMAAAWAKQFDANSMVALRKASVRFDAERELDKIRAKVLYVLSRTDKLFPPSIAPGVMDKLAKAGVDAKYLEIDTDFGHSASGAESRKWAPALEAFLTSLGK
jgi:homoserine O-acetyltransferase